ncbi:hypothetical protein D082_24990 [Synechocystis sp. PCC 6714]|nr:hypothetical protein D082_24990 [Synechocystis sp. PCC 6714]
MAANSAIARKTILCEFVPSFGSSWERKSQFGNKVPGHC